jgi:hypothetical protein
MSSAGSYSSGGSGGMGNVLFLEGNSGGAVGPDLAGVINVVGSGTITVSGDPGTNTLTVQLSGSGVVTSIDGDTGSGPITGDLTITGGASGASFDTTGTTITQSFNFLSLPATDNPLTMGYISFEDNPVLALYGGDPNIYLGVSAGNVAQTGSACVGIGNGALVSGTNNNNETAVGYLALQNANGTVGNTALGSNVLVSNTDSDYNTAVGLASLALLTGTTGNGNNVAIGYNSLANLLTGTDNIALGTGSGFSYTSSEDSNITIGNEGTVSESNVIRIGTQGNLIGQQNATYVAGIYNAAVGGTNAVVFADNTGKLGTTGGGSIPLGTTNHAVQVGNAGGTLTSLTVGTNGQVLVGSSAANPVFATLGSSASTLTYTTGAGTLNIDVTAPLAIAYGGTNATSMATTDGVVYFDGTRLVTTAAGTAAQVLTSNGAGMAPTFQAAAGGGVTSITGDSGGALTGALTLTGGTSGAVFSGAGTTLTESFNFLSLPDTNGAGTNGVIKFNSTNVLAFYGGGSEANIAFGFASQNASISGENNIGVGSLTLSGLTSANSNIAIGSHAATAITSGSSNVAIGTTSLGKNTATTANQNVAVGHFTLNNLLTGATNIAVGYEAGSNYTSSESGNILIGNTGTVAESDVIRIGSGTQTTCYIQGIAGVTVSNSAAVLIDTVAGQLGTVVSSRRFKEDIHDLHPHDSRKLYDLRPVEFTYKGSDQKQFGLISEEVEEVMPYLVAYDKESQPVTVRYHELPTLLLKELQRLNDRITALEDKLAARIR